MMSKQMNVCLSLLVMFLNQSLTEVVFFHWLILVAAMILLLIQSRIFLLIWPISDFVGLINLRVGLFTKFGLWSFRVVNASLLAVMSTRSAISNSSVIFLSSFFIRCAVVMVVFLYDFVMFFSRRSLHIGGSNL